MGVRANAKTKGDEEDRLSKLPDDILLTIFERLDIHDVTRASSLSRRLSQIPTMLSRLSIKVTSFLEPRMGDNSKLTLDDSGSANATMCEATKSILARRNDNQCTIQHLSLQFYLGDESFSIGQTVGGTMESQMVSSVEFEILTKTARAHCKDDDLLVHGRQLMLLIAACPKAFGGLTRLKLENVTLDEVDFPNIFNTCKKLQALHLNNCDMGMLSFLEVEHPLLSELEMDNCCFERVHLKWLPNLVVLTFYTWITQEDPLSFGYVPLLQSVSLINIGLSWHKMLKLSELLVNTTISSLCLNFKSEKIWVQPEGPKNLLPVFHKLKFVSLINVSEECDLNWTFFFLQAAPSLEKLHITVRDHLCEMLRDKELRRKYAYSEERKGVDWEGGAASDHEVKHHKLSMLKIFGFRPEDKFVRYVRRVMEAAVNLEDIFLFNKVVCERCKHKVPKASRSPWRKKQRDSIRNRIICGTNSFATIHFPSCFDTRH